MDAYLDVFTIIRKWYNKLLKFEIEIPEDFDNGKKYLEFLGLCMEMNVFEDKRKNFEELNNILDNFFQFQTNNILDYESIVYSQSFEDIIIICILIFYIYKSKFGLPEFLSQEEKRILCTLTSPLIGTTNFNLPPSFEAFEKAISVVSNLDISPNISISSDDQLTSLNSPRKYRRLEDDLKFLQNEFDIIQEEYYQIKSTSSKTVKKLESEKRELILKNKELIEKNEEYSLTNSNLQKSIKKLEKEKEKENTNVEERNWEIKQLEISNAKLLEDIEKLEQENNSKICLFNKDQIMNESFFMEQLQILKAENKNLKNLIQEQNFLKATNWVENKDSEAEGSDNGVIEVESEVGESLDIFYQKEIIQIKEEFEKKKNEFEKEKGILNINLCHEKSTVQSLQNQFDDLSNGNIKMTKEMEKISRELEDFKILYQSVIEELRELKQRFDEKSIYYRNSIRSLSKKYLNLKRHYKQERHELIKREISDQTEINRLKVYCNQIKTDLKSRIELLEIQKKNLNERISKSHRQLNENIEESNGILKLTIKRHGWRKEHAVELLYTVNQLKDKCNEILNSNLIKPNPTNRYRYSSDSSERHSTNSPGSNIKISLRNSHIIGERNITNSLVTAQRKKYNESIATQDQEAITRVHQADNLLPHKHSDRYRRTSTSTNTFSIQMSDVSCDISLKESRFKRKKSYFQGKYNSLM